MFYFPLITNIYLYFYISIMDLSSKEYTIIAELFKKLDLMFQGFKHGLLYPKRALNSWSSYLCFPVLGMAIPGLSQIHY